MATVLHSVKSLSTRLVILALLGAALLVLVPLGSAGAAPSARITPPVAVAAQTGRATAPGPMPKWLTPVMVRATYGAKVPQAWAKRAALATLLWRESAFKPTAKNPGSTAYGLFQFLDDTWAGVGCTKAADAYRQSVCGLRYVARRYGSPERALAFWLAQSPHWY